MSFTFEIPDSIPGSSRIQQEGWFHCVITEIDEEPRDGSNALLNGFKPTFEVLDGTARANNICTERGNVHSEMFFNPRPDIDKKTTTDRAVARQTRFFIATGLLDPNKIGKEKSVNINLADALQKQVVVKMVPGYKNPEYLEIDYASIYAVDDPKVAAVPKDVAALRLIGKESAAAPTANTSTAANGNGTAKATTTKAAARSTPNAPNPAASPDPNNANAARGQSPTSASGATSTAAVASGGNWNL